MLMQEHYLENEFEKHHFHVMIEHVFHSYKFSSFLIIKIFDHIQPLVRKKKKQDVRKGI